jgi:hypothetical protein
MEASAWTDPLIGRIRDYQRAEMMVAVTEDRPDGAKIASGLKLGDEAGTAAGGAAADISTNGTSTAKDLDGEQSSEQGAGEGLLSSGVSCVPVEASAASIGPPLAIGCTWDPESAVEAVLLALQAAVEVSV